jgi:hypothetical protein
MHIGGGHKLVGLQAGTIGVSGNFVFHALDHHRKYGNPGRTVELDLQRSREYG